MCNKYIKFHYFKEFVKKKLDIDYMATGHYATISYCKDPVLLLREGDARMLGMNSEIESCGDTYPMLGCGLDSHKDQSYFLSMTPVSRSGDIDWCILRGRMMNFILLYLYM